MTTTGRAEYPVGGNPTYSLGEGVRSGAGTGPSAGCLPIRIGIVP